MSRRPESTSLLPHAPKGPSFQQCCARFFCSPESSLSLRQAGRIGIPNLSPTLTPPHHPQCEMMCPTGSYQPSCAGTCVTCSSGPCGVDGYHRRDLCTGTFADSVCVACHPLPNRSSWVPGGEHCDFVCDAGLHLNATGNTAVDACVPCTECVADESIYQVWPWHVIPSAKLRQTHHQSETNEPASPPPPPLAPFFFLADPSRSAVPSRHVPPLRLAPLANVCGGGPLWPLHVQRPGLCLHIQLLLVERGPHHVGRSRLERFVPGAAPEAPKTDGEVCRRLQDCLRPGLQVAKRGRVARGVQNVRETSIPPLPSGDPMLCS